MNTPLVVILILILIAWIYYDNKSFEYWNMLLWSISAVVGFLAIYDQLEQNNKLLQQQQELLQQYKQLHEMVKQKDI